MSTAFTVYVELTGQILYSGTSDNPLALLNSGEAFVPEAHPALGWLGTAGSFTSLPPQPSSNHVFNWVTKVWEDPRTLDDLRTAAKKAINASWDRTNLSGFNHQGLVFATDISSRSDIDGINGYVALTGTFPDGWAGVWKAKDNSYLPITTVEQWVAFYTSMVRAGNENFAKAQQLKAQIAAAMTKEEVEAITW